MIKTCHSARAPLFRALCDSGDRFFSTNISKKVPVFLDAPLGGFSQRHFEVQKFESIQKGPSSCSRTLLEVYSIIMAVARQLRNPIEPY